MKIAKLSRTEYYLQLKTTLFYKMTITQKSFKCPFQSINSVPYIHDSFN